MNIQELGQHTCLTYEQKRESLISGIHQLRDDLKISKTCYNYDKLVKVSNTCLEYIYNGLFFKKWNVKL